jgi:hypothetical protein
LCAKRLSAFPCSIFWILHFKWKKKHEIPILKIEPSLSFEQVNFTVRKDNKPDDVIEKLEKFRFYLSKKNDNSRERFLLLSATQPNSRIIGMKFFLYYKDVVIANIHISKVLHHRTANIFLLPGGILDSRNLPLKSPEEFDEKFLKIEILSFSMMK